MAYATIQNMIDRYGELPLIELSDRDDPPTHAIVPLVVDAALLEAGAMIDAFIASRYSLPLFSVPDVLRRHCCVIAYYDLHRGRYPDEVRKDYEDTISFLKSLSRGEAKLDVAGEEPTSQAADARVEGPARLFNRTSLEGY